jgi:hypothetical protein
MVEKTHAPQDYLHNYHSIERVDRFVVVHDSAEQ